MRFLNEMIQKKKAELDLRPTTEARAFRERTINIDALGNATKQNVRDVSPESDFDRFAANGQPSHGDDVSRPKPLRATNGAAHEERQLDSGAATESHATSGNAWNSFSASIDQIEFASHYERRARSATENDASKAEHTQPVSAKEDTGQNELTQQVQPRAEDAVPAERESDAAAAELPDVDAPLTAGNEDPYDFLMDETSDSVEAHAPPDDALPNDSKNAWDEEVEEPTPSEASMQPEDPFAAPIETETAVGARPSEVADPIIEQEAKRHIWDVDIEEATAEMAPEDSPPSTETTASNDPDPQFEEFVAPMADEAAPRRSGRVRTRLLGFHRPDDAELDPFSRGSVTSESNARVTFPVGWLIVEKGPGRGTYFALSDGASKIGRGEDQVVQLDFGDTSISRDNHAVIAYDNEQRTFFLGHGGKANLVRLNGMPVLSTEPIENGDRIRIGETTLRFVALCGADFDWNDESDRGGLDVAAG